MVVTFNTIRTIVKDSPCFFNILIMDPILGSISFKIWDETCLNFQKTCFFNLYFSKKNRPFEIFFQRITGDKSSANDFSFWRQHQFILQVLERLKKME